MFRARLKLHQLFQGRDKIIRDGAADAAIGQFKNVLLWAIGDCAGFKDFTIDTHIAKFVDDNGQPFATRILHQMAD